MKNKIFSILSAGAVLLLALVELFGCNADKIKLKFTLQTSLDGSGYVVSAAEGDGKSIEIPEENAFSKVIGIGQSAFEGKTKLEKVTIPATVKTIGKNAFKNCVSLKSVDIKGNSLLKIEQGAFEGCASLESIRIPASVETLEDGAFKECVGLKEFIAGDSGSDLKNISSGVFEGCENLSRVVGKFDLISDIGSDIKIKEIAIHDDIVYGFGQSLDTPYQPSEKVLSIEKIEFTNPAVSMIGDYAFSACAGLKSVTIPNTVTYIGKGAFASCAQLAITLEEGNEKYDLENGALYCKDLSTPEYGYLYAVINAATLPQNISRLCSGSVVRSSAEEFTLPGTLSYIENFAFMPSCGIKKLTLFDNANLHIESKAFALAPDGFEIRFVGSADRWASLSQNSDLSGVTVTIEG